MSTNKNSRRGFLKLAGAGVAGSAALASTQSIGAQLTSAAAASGDYDVKAFGAKGDGTSLDTAAINRAIEVAAASGGGMVRFTAGAYLSYSIRLRSNVALY